MKKTYTHFQPGLTLPIISILLLLLLQAGTLFAQNNYTGPDGGAWHDNANWSLGNIPISTDNVVIPASTSVVVGAGQAAIQITNLTIGSGGGLTLSDANFLATGTSSLAGSITDNTSGGTNQFNGAATTTGNFQIVGNQAFRFCNTFTIGAGFTFTNNCTHAFPTGGYAVGYTVGPASGVTTATPVPGSGFGGLTIQGLLNGSDGSSQFTNGTNAFVTLNSTVATHMGTGVFDVSATGNTVRWYNSTAGGNSARDLNYFNVTYQNSDNTHTLTLTANRTISGIMNVSGGRFNISAASARTLTINGELIGNSTRSPALSINANVTVNVNGNMRRWAAGGGTFGPTGGGVLNIASGATYFHQLNGSTVVTANWAAGSTLVIGANLSAATTTTQPGGMGQSFSNVNWNVTNQASTLNPLMRGTGAMGLANISGRLSIQSTGAGTLALNDDGSPITQSVGSFEQTGGTFFLNNGSNNGVTNILNVLGDFNQSAGTITNNVTNANARGIIRMGGTAGPQNFTASGTLDQLFNLEINNTSGTPNVNLGSGITTTGASRLTNLVLTAGNLVFGGTARVVTIRGSISGAGGINMSGAAHTLNAEGTVAFGSLTAGSTSTFNYNQGSDGQAVATANYANLGFSNFNKTLPAGTVGVAGTLSPGSATGHTLTGNTINFNGSGPQNIPAFPNPSGYNNVSTSGGGTKTLTANTIVASSLTLSAGVLNLAGFNLTVAGSILPGAAYSGTNMIRTSGSGRLQKTGTSASSFVMVYPLGTGSLYTPMEITSLTATVASGQINVRAVGNQNPNVTGPNALDKYWEISTSGITAPIADIQFSYANPAEVNGTQTNYVGRYWDGLAWVTPTGLSAAGANPFSSSGTTTLVGEWTAGEPGSFLVVTTYTSTGGGGDWDTPGTWSPSGPPTSIDNVIISNGNPVTVSANGRGCNNMTIQAGAILTLGTTTGHTFSTVTGTGTIRLSSGNYPTGNFTAFNSIAGGTTEFLGGSYTLPNQTTFDNLVIGGTGTKTSGANLTVLGDLTVQGGTGLDLSVSNHTLDLSGNFSASGAFASGTGLHTFSGTSKGIASSSALSIDNLSITGSYTQNAGSMAVASSLSGTGSLVLAGGVSLNLGGSVSLNSLSASASGTTVNYSQSSAGQNVLAGTYHDLQFSNFNKVLPAGTITINNVFSPGSATGHTVTGNTIVFNGSAGQVIPGTQYNNLSNGNSNSRVLDPANTIFIAGLFTPGTNSYTIGTSTVEYNSNGVSQTVADLNSYYNLRFSGTAGTRTWSVGGPSPRNVTVTNQLVIGGNANLTVAGNNVSGERTFTATNTGANAIVMNSGQISLTGNLQFYVNGTFTNLGGGFNAGLGSAFQFPLATSVFIHDFNGGNLPNIVSFSSSATCRVIGVTTSAPGNVNQAGWGNFEWNCPGQTSPLGFGSGTRTFNNFDIKNTGTSYFTWAGGGANNSTINGNLTIDAGAKSYSYSQASGASASPVVNGNLTVNGLMELHNDNFGGASFQTWQVYGDVSVGSSGIIQRTSNTSSKIQMAGTVDKVLTIATGGSFASGLLEINKTSGAKVTLGSNVTLPGLTFVSGNIEVSGGRVLTYTGTASPARTSGHVALAVGGTNLFRWNAPGATAITTFDFPVGPVGAVTGYRRIRLQNFTTPAGSPSITIGYTNNPGTSPTNATSIRSTPSTVLSSRVFQEISFSGGTFGTGDITLEADVATDFFNGPILPVDMDIFKAPPGAQAWQFIGSGPIPGVNGSNTTVNQAGVVFASGLNRMALGKSNLLDLGTPQVLSWTGLVSNDWSNQANWNPSQVPSAFNQKITIPNTGRNPVYTGGAGLNIRGLFIGLGAGLTYQGDLGVDSAFTNSGTFSCSGLFTTSGANFTGPPVASVFNFGGSNGVSNLGGWLVTNTSTSGVVVGSSSQIIRIADSLKLNTGAKLNLNGASLTLRSSALKTSKIGTIPSTASLTGATNVTWQRHIPNSVAGWHFLGTPIQGQTLSEWGDDFDIYLPLALPNVYNMLAPQANLFEFDGTANPVDGVNENELNGWRIPTSGTVQVGKGYRAWIKSYGFSGIMDNTGTVTQGDFTFSTPFNASGYSGGGWVFTANPYPAALNWDAPTNASNWTKTNVNNAVYIWNGASGQYMSYVAGVGTNGGTNIIPSGQGFVVKVGSGATLTARENVKFSGSGTFARTAVAGSVLRIRVSAPNGASDENALRVHPSATEGFNPDWDAFKLPGGSIELAVQSMDGNLSVQTLGSIQENTIVPLSLRSGSAGTHIFRFENLEGFLPEGAQAYFKDLYTNTLQPITEGAEIPVVLSSDPASQGSDRFELVFSTESITSVSPVPSGLEVRIFPNPSRSGKLNLTSGQPLESGSVRITDLRGREVFSQKLPSGNRWTLEPGLPAGMYRIQLESGNEKLSQTILFH